MDERDRKVVGLRPFRRVLEEIDDHLVAHRRDPDPQPGADECADDLAAGVGLAGARRSLDGKHVAVELDSNPAGGVEGAFAVVLQSALGVCGRRRPAEQEVRRRAVRRAQGQTLRQDRRAETHQRLAERIGADMVVQDHGARLDACARLRVLDVDGTVVELDGFHPADPGAVEVVGRVAGARVDVLRRVSVPFEGRAPRLDGLDVHEALEGPPFIAEVALLERLQAEVLPPARLVLPAVEFHHVGEREAGLFRA